MIARIWRGKTRKDKADAYTEYLALTGVRQCLATEGNNGVLVFRESDADVSEFIFISLWNSLEVIKGFAGPDILKAVFYPEDHQYLIDLNPIIEHYEVVINTALGGQPPVFDKTR